MVTFRNNKNYNRRRYRSNDRNFRRSGDNVKFKSDFSTNVNFQRKTPGRNNHNASKLIEKYNNLAREALANEDKILSESYFQYADHFTRVLSEREKNKPINEIKTSATNKIHVNSEKKNETDLEVNKEVEKKTVGS